MIFVAGGIALLCLSVLRFGNFEEEFFYEFCLNFYYLLLGVISCVS